MADGFFTCGVTPIGAGPVIFNQVDLMNRRADGLLTTTLDLADGLANYNVANLSFQIDPFDVQTYTIRSLDDVVDFDTVDIGLLDPLPTIGPAVIPTLPVITGAPDSPPDAPAPVIDPSPTAYHPTFGATPIAVFPVTPTYEDLTAGIPFPTLRPIVLPAPPSVDFGIQFTATPPVFTAQAPDASDFNYTEQAYDPLLLDETKAVIQRIYAGETGIPRVVEEALFAREADREDEAAEVAYQQAFDEMAVRGFTLPSGPLQSKLMQTRQNSQNQKVSLSRDVMIRIHEVLVDQLKFGVAQGIALENAWIGLYSDIQNRRLQAAQVAVNIAISVYNALVAQYEAQASVFKVEADVYATRIQAELAKLQGYAEQIRAQQLIGEINQQDVEIYKARLGAIETNVRVYLAEIEAYTALINGEKLKLDTFRTSIEVEQTKLSASQLELQIWTGSIQGQSLIQQAYATRAQTYIANIDAWKTKYGVEIERQRGEIAREEANSARYLARIQGIVAQGNLLVAKGQAVIANNTSRVQRYSANAQWTSSYNSALSEKIRMINSANAQNTEIALKNGEINAQNGLAVAQTEEGALQTATQVLAQMTSSFASSVSMGANVGDQTSFQQSCNYSTSQSFD